MEQSILPIATLALFAYGANTLLKYASSRNSYKRGGTFPKCLQCGNGGVKVNLAHGVHELPDEIEYRVNKLGLDPEKVVTRYVCVKGCTQMWYLPRLGDMEKGIVRSQRL